MQSWFQNLTRTTTQRNDRKNRRQRPAWRARFDALDFAIERLEDRMLLAADLTLEKTVTPTTPVVAGELLTYTITAANPAGGTTTNGVMVTDMLPAGETFVGATVTGSGAPTVSTTGNTVTVNLGTLNAGDSDIITIQALVTDTTLGDMLVNKATMSNTSNAPNPTPATATNEVLGLPTGGTVDLSVTKTAATSPAVVGSPEVYTLVVKNNSSDTAATGVTLIDTLPANADNYSSSAGPGAITGNVLTDTIGNLAAGDSRTVTVSVTPTAGTVLVNTAAVAGDQADTTPGNNAAVVTTPIGGGVTASTVDLSVTKTAGTSLATTTAAEVYTVIVKNNSTTTDATGVTLIDTLPANASSYVSSAGTIAGNVLTDVIGNLGRNQSRTITVSVTPTVAGSVLVNTAAVAGDQVDTSPANNVATVLTPVSGTMTLSSVDLSVTKTAATNPATVGAAEVYTIVVKNNEQAGGTGATGVTLTDVLPANANAATSSAGTITGNVLTDPIGALAAGESRTVTVSVTPTAGTTLVNTAAVVGDQADATPANNIAVLTTPIGGGVTTSTVDLSVTKTAATSTATMGTAEVYTVIVKNNSANTPATGVTLIDTLPANADNYSSTAGTIAGNVLTDAIGSLAAGASSTVTISVTPTVPGSVLVNTAAVAGDQVDTSPGNNVATVLTPVSGTVTGTNVDLSVTKTAATSPATVGTAEVYTIVVKNNSAGTAASGVTLTDVLPANANAATSSAGTITGNVLTYAIGDLGAGDSKTVTVSVTPTAGTTLVNTAAVVGDQADSTPANNVAVLTTPIGGGVTTSTVDLSVTKTAASNPATVGAAEVYTVIVKNNSANTPATGVTLIDTLPTNANAYSSTAGTIAGNVLTDAIGNLAAGASSTVTISVTPNVAGSVLVNTAAVAGDQVDNTPGNNVATVLTPVSGTTTNATVDLSVTKTAATNTATVGTAEVYTIVVKNNSASTAATGVTLTDVLPTNANNATASAGTVTAGVLTDAIGNLAAGQSATVTVSVTPTAGTVLVNTAAVAGDQADNNSANNVAVVTTPIGGAVSSSTVDLSVTKTAASNPATVGTAEVYTIVVKNNSTNTPATGVTLVDTLPANANAYSSTGGTITGGVLIDSIGNLAAGQSATVTVSVTPTAGTSLVNTAAVAGDQVDNVPGNNAVVVTTPVQAVVPTTLKVTKTAAASIQAGQNLVYTITVQNTGANAATNAIISDTLPAGLTFVSAVDQTTTFPLTNTGGTISETVPSLAPGATETIQLIVTPATSLIGTSVTNTATATVTGGTPATGSATTLVTGIIPSGTHVCYLEGVPGNGDITTAITNLYYELLGRAPDSVGLAGWVSYGQAHQNFQGDYTIVQGFLNSPEYKAHFITCLYEAFLGRAPDPAGLQFWVDKMGNPGSPGQNTGSSDERFILAAFLGSDEYYARAGGTPEGFVNALYGDLLNRAPEANGMSFWVRELNAHGPGDRDGIIRDLLLSPEAAHQILDMFYPAPGGTANTPLPPVGTPAGLGGSKLNEVTGGGWENLYLLGPFDHTQEANDAFFAELAGGANWDDVQLQMLTTYQYFNNPNNPVTGTASITTYAGGFNYAGINGSAAVSINGTPGSAISGQFTLFDSNGQYLGAATFNGNATGTGTYAGGIHGIAGGPEQFTLTISGNQISGTLNGPGGVTGTFGPLSSNQGLAG